MRCRLRALLLKVPVVAPLCLSGYAGSATFNFDSDPALDPKFIIGSNVSWSDPATGEQIDFYEDRDFDGKGEGGNPATGGYLAINRSANSQYTQVLFPDFDEGLIVRAFSFDCDLRLGNPTGNDGRPADGFSINYARANDPAVQWLIDNQSLDITQKADSSNYAVAGGTENGTRTGISINFDTWSGNVLPDGGDVEGIMVRVDNVTVLRYGLPTRNGACDDATSLQTGPYDAATGGDYKGLCWAKLNVNLQDNGELTVKFKGKTLLDKFQTGFAPSAGRILVAGRTGGANENNHIDNLVITTVPADKAFVGRVSATASGITVLLEDSGQSIVDPNTVSVTADGTALAPVTVNKSGTTTTVAWSSPSFLASGKVIAVNTSFKDTKGVAIVDSRNTTVSAYYLLSEDTWTAPGTGDGTKPGVKARIYQVDQVGSQGLYNYTRRAEQQLAGIVGPNVADLTGANGVIFHADMINWNQDFASAEIGNFQTSSTPSRPDEAIPGIPGLGNPSFNTDNIAGELISYLEFPSAGMYTMGVNSDDGFRVTGTDLPPVNNLALVITGAASAAGSYHAVLAPPATGKPITGPISGKLVYVDPAEGCTTPVNAAALRGNIALVDRGTCEFTAKIKLALEAGAIAVVVANNRDENSAEGIFPIEMGAGAAGYQDVPSLMISLPDGLRIKTGFPGELMASLTPDTTPAIGEFEGGRGATDTLFPILAPKPGVYPFRCIWYEGNGGANLEWFTVTASGEKVLVNDRANPAALKSFRARTANPEPGKPTVSVGRQAGNVVVTFTGTLQTATSLAGPWVDSTASSPLAEPTTGEVKYYRSRK